MAISNELVTKFVTIMGDDKKTKSNDPVYGTITKYGEDLYVKLDGSDILTPMTSSVDVEDGERVLVSIVNHTATVVGNVTSPAARKKQVDSVSGDMSDFNNKIELINNTIVEHGNNITQINNRITEINDKIVSQDNDITLINNKITQQGNDITQINNTLTQQGNKITQIDNDIKQQGNKITEIGDTITSQGNEITLINNKITQRDNEIKQIGDKVNSQGNEITQISNKITQQGNTIDEMNDKITSRDNEITQINNKLTLHDNTITVINSSFKIENNVVTGIKGIDTDWIMVKELEADHEKVGYLEANKADIDLANVNNAWIQNGTIIDGSIGSAAIHDGAITNVKIADATIEAAKIKSINADTIVAGTIKTERLIITSEDGTESIVKAINTANGVPEAEVNGQQIQAASIDVVDLSAFQAKIADFDMNQNAIYSGKTSIKDPSSGIYISTTGLGIGNGLLTGKDESPIQMYADGTFKLEGKQSKLDFNGVTGVLNIEATSIKIASKTVVTEDDLAKIQNETTTILTVSSSNGTKFKDRNTGSVLTVSIQRGNKTITNITELHEAFGDDAFLSWSYRKNNDEGWSSISDTDSRIGQNGFTLTVSPDSYDWENDYKCELGDTPYDVLILDESQLENGVLA